jgi:hypothetical protein
MISSCHKAPVVIGRVFIGYCYNCAGEARPTYGAGYVCNICNQECLTINDSIVGAGDDKEFNDEQN